MKITCIHVRHHRASSRLAYLLLPLVLLACTAGTTVLGQLHFAESDYRVHESEGRVNVTLELSSPVDGVDFTVRVTPLTYKQFQELHGSLPLIVTESGIDPAELSDFDPAFVDVTIIGSKGGGSTDFIASIPIFSDGIDELEEGFIAMMEVLGGVSIILDEPRLTFVKIIDDDALYIKFSEKEYTETEGAGSLTLELNKVNGTVTEVNYTLGFDDLPVEETGIVFPKPGEIVFPASETSVFIPIEVVDDNKVQGGNGLKTSTLRVHFNENLGIRTSTNITIAEDDEVKVGFGEKKIEDGLLILNLVPTGAEYAGTNVVTFSVTLSSDSETDTISAHPFLEPTGVVTQTLFEVQNVIATLGYEVTAKLTIVSHESNIKVDPENDVLYITFDMPTPTSPPPPPPPPPPPVIESVVVVNEKDLNITWIPPDAPVDQYGVLIKVGSGADSRKRESSLEEEGGSKEFITNDTHYLYENANLTLTYIIQVRSERGGVFGEYSAPYNFTYSDSPTPAPSFRWWWVFLPIVLVLLLFCCILWVLLLLCCCLFRDRREKISNQDENSHSSVQSGGMEQVCGIEETFVEMETNGDFA